MVLRKYLFFPFFLPFATVFLHFTGKNVLCSCAIKWVIFILFWKFEKCFIKFNPFEMHSQLCLISSFTFFVEQICPIYMEWPCCCRVFKVAWRVWRDKKRNFRSLWIKLNFISNIVYTSKSSQGLQSNILNL